MEFLKRNWTQIQAQLGDLSFATKWLIGSLVVIMLLVGGMLVYWGGAADRVPIDGVASGSPGEIVAVLQTDGVDAALSGGEVTVPVSQREQAIAALSRAGHISPNAAAAFDKLVTETSWMDSQSDKDRKYLLAKQQFLSAVISSFPNVETASVILDKPGANGFGGASHIDPSASVMVTMRPGSRVTKPMADTLIHMVASAEAGLQEQDVTISDTINSRSFTAADDDDLLGGLASLEATLANERRHKQKIESLLAPWPGAMVAVKIVADPTQHEERTEIAYEEKQPLLSEETENSEQSNFSNAGEPGPRAMLSSSIDGSGGSGTESTMERSLTQFATAKPIRQSSKRIAGNTIRQINVSVVIPRSYYERIYTRQNPEAEPPSDDELANIITQQQDTIKELIRPQIVSGGEDDETFEPGDITVAMSYDQAYLEPVTAGVGGGLGAVVSSEMAHTGMLAGLAVMSLGLFLYMVRRATRPDEMPTIEELAGVPPTLPTDDDLMGEVEEMDNTLAGVELDEEELRARQIADQISDLVRANPEEAGGLLTKWVVDDHS